MDITVALFILIFAVAIVIGLIPSVARVSNSNLIF